MHFKGTCHCSAHSFTYSIEKHPSIWKVNACQCSFCVRHGAQTTRDPYGTVLFSLQESLLTRYRFNQKIADYLICKNCGVYLAAVMVTKKNGAFATLNTRCFDAETQKYFKAISPAHYNEESPDARINRRIKGWAVITNPEALFSPDEATFS